MPAIIDLSTPPTSPRSKRQRKEQHILQPPISVPSPLQQKASTACSLTSNPHISPVSAGFIADPIERVKQCIKVLCGNVGIVSDNFITLAVAQKGINSITADTMQMLDESFFGLLRLPQRARAEAAKTYLKPLKPFMASSGIYLHTVKVPRNASFWKEYAWAFDFDGIDISRENTLVYIGSTTRSFGRRVEKEHMNSQYHIKTPSLHYAAMDEPKAESNWYLLAATPKGTDQATVRILEATAIATMHTFTSPSYTAILSKYGVVEASAKAFGLNRTGAMRDWGVKTMDSALQIVLHQRLIEEYGGEPWELGRLPPVVANWYQPLDTKLKDFIIQAVREGTSVSKVFNSVMGQLGARACQEAHLAQSVQKVLSGGLFQLKHNGSKGHQDIGFNVFRLGPIAVKHYDAKYNDYVSVNFIIGEGTHPLRWATDALQTDPGRRLAILVSGQDASGKEWKHWCKTSGDIAAMKANSYFDLITGTGVAMTNEKIPRRCYRVPSQLPTRKDPYQADFFYTDKDWTGSMIKAREDMHPSESLMLQQDHEGGFVIDTPPRDIREQSKVTKPQSSKEHNSGNKRKFEKIQTSFSKPAEDQAFSEAELQDIMGSTDLLVCFARWVEGQGSSYVPFQKLTIAAKKAATAFRVNLEGHETCFGPLLKLSEKNLGTVFVRLCKNKVRDDAEALL